MSSWLQIQFMAAVQKRTIIAGNVLFHSATRIYNSPLLQNPNACSTCWNYWLNWLVCACQTAHPISFPLGSPRFFFFSTFSFECSAVLQQGINFMMKYISTHEYAFQFLSASNRWSILKGQFTQKWKCTVMSFTQRSFSPCSQSELYEAGLAVYYAN